MRRLATGQASEADLVREALSEEYDQFEELGRGGMALVYRARERALERDVAIKVLPASFTFDQEFVERFQHEARIAARLEHPNIIPIYRVGRSGQVTYFVMKYVRGGTLKDLLKEHGQLRPAEIRRLLLEAGAALGYAADHGVVHRDIKPDNIMLDEFGRAVLADFGIAKAVTRQKLTGTGLSIGTPRYMSPEQARAQDTDGRSDIYSLGIVAYQCLTGSVPFDGDDGFQIGYKHVSEPLPRPKLTTDDERSLYAILERMLAKDPKDRFQSAAELEQALAGQEIAPSIVRAKTRTGPPIVLMPGEEPPRPALEATVAMPVMPPPMPPPGEGRTVPREDGEARQGARRVANRSAAMKRGRVSSWPIVLLLLIAAPAVGFWYWRLGRRAPAADANGRADSAEVASAASTDSGPAAGRDSPGAGTVPVTPPPAAQDTTRDHAAVPPAATAPVLDSGAIRIRNLPAGSEVLIDERRAMSAVTRLPEGTHVVAISAPRHRFYAETVSVHRNDTLLLAPVLTRLGTPAAEPTGAGEIRQAASSDPCEPGPQWDGTECFDVRPRPLSTPYVALPAGVRRVARPAEFWIYVGLSGASEEIRLLRSSGSSVFDRSARTIARSLEWTPAQRNGAAVGAWTQLAFPASQ
jgi:predicted Ser/Thr protein kinase